MAKEDQARLKYCGPKLKIEKRPLLDVEQAVNLEAIFKVLANRTRLRLLHALIREPDTNVGEVAERLNMNVPAVSNQLQMLALRGIVSSRRNGNKISYRIIDPCIKSLLDYGLCLTEDLRSGGQIPVMAIDSS
jgi:DNA-binding transcriptional ArsR family regulator